MWCRVFACCLVFFALPAWACNGDDANPVIERNGKIIFSGKAEDVYDEFPLELMPVKARQGSKQGVLLSELFEKGVKVGSITVYNCGEKSVTFSLAELRQAAVDAKQLFLVLSKKRVLKLVRTQGREEKGTSVLMRVTRVQVVSEGP